MLRDLRATISDARQTNVRVQVLGRFVVVLGGGEIAAASWRGRRARELVQVLALADGHRLAREQVIEALWPRLDPAAGAANLRKAAHYARRACSSPDAVVLRGGTVALFPLRSVETDAGRFDAQARTALARGDAAACAAAAAGYGGELLPEAAYEEWTQAPREHLRALFVELLRRSGQWERVVEVEPTDEAAYRELMQRELAAGSRPAAIRWYGRLRTALRRELGIAPGAATEAIFEECIAGLGTAEAAFVGRELELARATALLRAADGEIGALVVRGPAGIGKSAFCREVAPIAQAEGRAVLTVRATEEGTPYAPLVAAVERLAARDRELLDVVGDRGRSVLAKLTAVAAPAAPLEAPLTRHRVTGALRGLLGAAGGDAGVVLVVDDAHLADAATIEVLLHLASTGATPMLIVLAYRPKSGVDVLTGGVARLARAGRALEIDLGPLDREETAALVTAAAPVPRAADVVDRIVDLAQGNPFFALELARSAVAGVPALVTTAADAIASRFLDLDGAALAVLRRLALAGGELDTAEVLALTGEPEARAFELLDVALNAGVLVVSGECYRFRHELVREVLVEQLAPHERLVAHRDAARRLADAGAAPAAIARHWLDGGRPEEAADWLLAAAAHAVELGAFADAVGHLEPLLEHEPDHRDALRLRAEALDALGDLRAPAAYAAAARVVRRPLADELKAQQALAQVKLGDPAGGLRVLDGVEPQSLHGHLAHALALSGAAAVGFGDAELGTRKAAEARALARRSGDPAAVVVASWAQAAAAHARGELRHSVLADLRDTHALPKLAVSVFDGQLCITQRLLYGERPYPEVIAFADSLAAEAERLGAARGRAFAVTLRGEAKLLAGRLEEADADLVLGARLHRELAAPTGEAFALQRRAELALYGGRRREAAALVDESLAIARESEVGFHLFDRIYGTHVAAAPDPGAALAALEEAENAVRGPLETCPGCRITLAVPAAIASARAGDLERAAKWEQAAEYLATVVMRLPAWYAALDEVKGHRAQASGDASTARKQFRTAADGFRAAGQPLDEARCTALEAALV